MKAPAILAIGLALWVTGLAPCVAGTGSGPAPPTVAQHGILAEKGEQQPVPDNQNQNGYDEKAANFRPKREYDLFPDEKELSKQMERGEIEGEVMVKGQLVPAKYVNGKWVPAR